MDSGIYAIVAPNQKIIYVGQSQNMRRRWSSHKHALKQPHGVRRANPFLRRAWNKYGEDAFDFVVLEECDISRLTEREAYWLDRARARHNLRVANTEGPVDNPMRGQKHRPETIKKLSEASSAFPRTEAHRAAIGAAHRGKKASDQAKANMSAVRRGKPQPNLMGDKNPSRRPEFRARMSGDGNPAKRPEVREKMRQRAAWKVEVECVDTGQRWESISACAREVGGSAQNLSHHLKGKTKTCQGRRFRVAKEKVLPCPPTAAASPSPANPA